MDPATQVLIHDLSADRAFMAAAFMLIITLTMGLVGLVDVLFRKKDDDK